MPIDPLTSTVLDRGAQARLARMSELAESFPTLANASGVRPFDARALRRWLTTSPAVTSGSAHAARFVLSVWAGTTGVVPKAQRFDLHAALQGWDDAHRRAFTTWIAAPWWP